MLKNIKLNRLVVKAAGEEPSGFTVTVTHSESNFIGGDLNVYDGTDATGDFLGTISWGESDSFEILSGNIYIEQTMAGVALSVEETDYSVSGVLNDNNFTDIIDKDGSMLVSTLINPV